MNVFNRRNGILYAEEVALPDIAAEYGTPVYVYSRAHIEARFRAYQELLTSRPHLICYAVKANSNLAVLNLLARLGAGFDIVSSGELERVLRAGGEPQKIVFSGVAKSEDDLRRALEAGIHCFNVESLPELHRLSELAVATGHVAPVSLRVNPDVDAGTHPYISTGLKDNKFGIAWEEAPDVYREAADLPGIRVTGLDCHIGSQLTSLRPFADAMDRLLVLVDGLEKAGITLQHLDLGGGLGVQYADENPPTPQEYMAVVLEKMAGRPHTLLFEPGRSIVANAGVLLTRIEYLKTGSTKNFAIIDAAMNDLLRPALYQAWMNIVPAAENPAAETAVYDVVGPVCESADFLGKNRELAVSAGDLLAVMSAGAYGFTMSSNYNTRNRAAEVMVDGDRTHLVRARETYEYQLQLENTLP